MNIEATVDSAAVDLVVPGGFMRHTTGRQSKVSSEGRHFVGANDTTIVDPR